MPPADGGEGDRGRRAAEEALRREAFDLAIIDLCLSGEGHPDGLELVRAARQANGRARVLVISADGTDDLKRQALEFGASGYFSKPINLDQLLSAAQAIAPPAP